jgi:hypothetical protein
MKKTILSIFSFLLLTTLSFSQINTPAASPFSKVEQAVGLVDVTVEYSRPGKKDRALFGPGNLVEYGKLYRTGANAVTKVSFSDDVTLNGEALAKGSYALLTTPGAEMWKSHFYPYEGRSWSSYKEKTPALTVSSKVIMLENDLETFTIYFSNFKNDGGDMAIAWGKVYVPIQIGVPTDEAVMANIEKVMAGPSNNDYYNAATYFHTSGKDLKQALAWIQMATNVEEPKFWQVRREALILADLGMKKEAIEAATKSKDLAMKAGNDDYVKMNEASIKEWSM